MGYQTKMHLRFERLSLLLLFLIYGELCSFPGICFICLAQPGGSMLLSGTKEEKEHESFRLLLKKTLECSSYSFSLSHAYLSKPHVSGGRNVNVAQTKWLFECDIDVVLKSAWTLRTSRLCLPLQYLFLHDFLNKI